MQTASHGNLMKHNVNAFLIVSPLPICQYEMGIIFTQWESKDGQQSCISIPSSYCQYTTKKLHSQMTSKQQRTFCEVSLTQRTIPG